MLSIEVFKEQAMKDWYLIPPLMERTIRIKFSGEVSRDISCMNENGDIWKEISTAFFKHYEATEFDNDGWLICNPKSRELEYYQADESGTVSGRNHSKSFYSSGDFVIRNADDIFDQWVISKKLFEEMCFIPKFNFSEFKKVIARIKK